MSIKFDDLTAQHINNGVEEVLLDAESQVFASSEDGKVFLIHDNALTDDHGLIAPVIDLARRAGLEPVSDVSNDNEYFASSVERVRWFA